LVGQWLNCHDCLFGLRTVAAMIWAWCSGSLSAPSHALQRHTPMPILGFSRSCRLLFLRVAGKTWTHRRTSISHIHVLYMQCTCARGAQYSPEHDNMDQGSTGSADPDALCLGPIRLDTPCTSTFVMVLLKRRALAGGRKNCASAFDPGGVGRASHGAAAVNQM
jgi:hypothetical protein